MPQKEHNWKPLFPTMQDEAGNEAPVDDYRNIEPSTNAVIKRGTEAPAQPQPSKMGRVGSSVPPMNRANTVGTPSITDQANGKLASGLENLKQQLNTNLFGTGITPGQIAQTAAGVLAGKVGASMVPETPPQDTAPMGNYPSPKPPLELPQGKPPIEAPASPPGAQGGSVTATQARKIIVRGKAGRFMTQYLSEGDPITADELIQQKSQMQPEAPVRKVAAMKKSSK